MYLAWYQALWMFNNVEYYYEWSPIKQGLRRTAGGREQVHRYQRDKQWWEHLENVGGKAQSDAKCQREILVYGQSIFIYYSRNR